MKEKVTKRFFMNKALFSFIFLHRILGRFGQISSKRLPVRVYGWTIVRISGSY